MTRLSILLCATTFACAATGAARTEIAPSASGWDTDATAPTVHEVASAAAQARARHCRTPSCKAIITIHDLADILQYEVATRTVLPACMSGTGRGSPADA